MLSDTIHKAKSTIRPFKDVAKISVCSWNDFINITYYICTAFYFDRFCELFAVHFTDKQLMWWTEYACESAYLRVFAVGWSVCSVCPVFVLTVPNNKTSLLGKNVPAFSVFWDLFKGKVHHKLWKLDLF